MHVGGPLPLSALMRLQSAPMARAIQSRPFLLSIAFMAMACTGDDGSHSKSDAGMLGGDGDGDGDGDRQCDLTGTYAVVLTPREGDCGPVADPAMLTVPASTSGVVMHTEMQLGRNAVTTTVIKGCGLRLTYEVAESSGLLVSTLNGEELEQVSEGRIEGRANVQRFTPTTPQTIACRGTYDMLMSKR